MTTPALPRLIDPVHFFNAAGFSVLTQQVMQVEIDRLTTELEESNRKVAILAKRVADSSKAK